MRIVCDVCQQIVETPRVPLRVRAQIRSQRHVPALERARELELVLERCQWLVDAPVTHLGEQAVGGAESRTLSIRIQDVRVEEVRGIGRNAFLREDGAGNALRVAKGGPVYEGVPLLLVLHDLRGVS